MAASTATFIPRRSRTRAAYEALLASHGHAEVDGQDVNVNDLERLASAIGGSALMMYGLGRGTLCGLGLAAVGGALVVRGASGHCKLYETLGLNTANARSQTE